MGVVSDIVAAMALGALGWWLLNARRRGQAWVGIVGLMAAAYFAVSGLAAWYGMEMVLSVVLGVGLWFTGLGLLLKGASGDRYLALAVLAAGTVMVATGAFVALDRSS